MRPAHDEASASPREGGSPAPPPAAGCGGGSGQLFFLDEPLIFNLRKRTEEECGQARGGMVTGPERWEAGGRAGEPGGTEADRIAANVTLGLGLRARCSGGAESPLLLYWLSVAKGAQWKASIARLWRVPRSPLAMVSSFSTVVPDSTLEGQQAFFSLDVAGHSARPH